MRAQEAQAERHEDEGKEAGAPQDVVSGEPGSFQEGPGEPAPRARDAEPDDFFYHGVIAAVNWSRGTGTVRSGNGREIPFEFPLVTMIGGERRIEHLLPGMRVGFDVGWTSKGLRVTAIKIYN
jgi:hypothetical protein